MSILAASTGDVTLLPVVEQLEMADDLRTPQATLQALMKSNSSFVRERAKFTLSFLAVHRLNISLSTSNHRRMKWVEYLRKTCARLLSKFASILQPFRRKQ